MPDLIDPFMTFYRDHPDYNRHDSRAEVQALTQRQEAIEDWLLGTSPEDAILETLLDQGISPDEYVEQIEANVDYVINAGIRFTSNDSGILLPTSYLRSG